MTPELIYLPEPSVLFNHGQSTLDVRDGLTLFGPLDQGKPYGIRYGLIGTADGIRWFKSWVEQIQHPISNSPPTIARPPFPGFESVFGIPWGNRPSIEVTIRSGDLSDKIHIDDKHQRVFAAVELYANKIVEVARTEEVAVDLWFVVVPDAVYKYCRPLSSVEPELRVKAGSPLTIREARQFVDSPALFDAINADVEPYRYEVNFHNQLKARLLEHRIVTQVIRESTLAYKEVVRRNGKPLRDLGKLQSAIAWHLCTTAFYKSGGRPWKLNQVRDGVCYVGVVFKRDERSKGPRDACCAAQMFLDSGDGVVFKGNVGPWYGDRAGDFHLDRAEAKSLVMKAIDSYAAKNEGKPPKELFLHGKVRFGDAEWSGFQEAAGTSTRVVGVRIRDARDIKLYRLGRNPVLRGLAYVRDDRTAFLWTRGLVPRLRTYPGREVPNSLLVDVCRGSASIETVLKDIMGLTKLNYNACIFADGDPVTLKFADAVGEILTAGPIALKSDEPPLPFKHYI